MINEGGDAIAFTVIDERNDQLLHGRNDDRKYNAYLYKLQRNLQPLDGVTQQGFGFYLWYDDDGHYVQEVTSGSPADSVGKLIEMIKINK